mgnify:CR=1 FL=1
MYSPLKTHSAAEHRTRSKHGFGGYSNAASNVAKMWVHQITRLEVGCCVNYFHDVETVMVPQMFVEVVPKMLVVGVDQKMLHLHYSHQGPQTLEVLR